MHYIGGFSYGCSLAAAEETYPPHRASSSLRCCKLPPLSLAPPATTGDCSRLVAVESFVSSRSVVTVSLVAFVLVCAFCSPLACLLLSPLTALIRCVLPRSVAVRVRMIRSDERREGPAAACDPFVCTFVPPTVAGPVLVFQLSLRSMCSSVDFIV